MRRVYIASAGPSLLDTWDDPQDGPRIAVNNAIKRVDCPFFCFGDPVMGRILPDYAHIVRHIIAPKTFEVRNHHGAQHTTWEYLRDISGLKPSYTFVYALLFARFGLDASEIVVYGHDMTAEDDCAGHNPQRRDPKRWKREQVDIDAAAQCVRIPITYVKGTSCMNQ